MKPSDKCLVISILTGIIAAAGLYWWIPDMHWGVYIGAAFIVAAAGYGKELQDTANKKIIDGDVREKA